MSSVFIKSISLLTKPDVSKYISLSFDVVFSLFNSLCVSSTISILLYMISGTVSFSISEMFFSTILMFLYISLNCLSQFNASIILVLLNLKYLVNCSLVGFDDPIKTIFIVLNFQY